MFYFAANLATGIMCMFTSHLYYTYHTFYVPTAFFFSTKLSQGNIQLLVYTTQVTLKQVKLLFGPLVIQLLWYILKQLFTSVGESGGYLPPLQASYIKEKTLLRETFCMISTRAIEHFI